MTETQEAEQLEVAPATTGTPHLNAALAAVQAELPRIDKGRTATVPTKAGGQYSYTYADLSDVAAAIKPLLGRNGLAFTAWPTLSLVTNRFVLRYELLHESGEQKGGEYPLPSPTEVGAQALGSAITYARRYCLCAVTGVAPDDDDDAAAADGVRQAERIERAEQQAEQEREEQRELDRELQHAVDVVRGAWAQQYGEFNEDQAAELFRTWSKGGSLRQAPAGQLRSFAAYLNTLPEADAGSDPIDAPPADKGVEVITDAPPMSRRDNAHMFVLFEKLGLKNKRKAQLEYLTTVLGRTIGSRGDVTELDAPIVLKALQADVKEAERTGLSPENVAGPAPDAQSAPGETNRVPSGPAT